MKSRSPTKLWVRVRSTETEVSGAVRPATAKLITSGAPKTGGVPPGLSGIGPTPVPANENGVQPGVAVGVAVGPPGVAVGEGVAVGPPGVGVGPPGVGVGVGQVDKPLTVTV